MLVRVPRKCGGCYEYGVPNQQEMDNSELECRLALHAEQVADEGTLVLPPRFVGLSALALVCYRTSESAPRRRGANVCWRLIS